MRTRYLLILAAVIFLAAGYVDHLDRPTPETVTACADRLGGASDGNLALCADWLGFPCGSQFTDPIREQCKGK